jgi:hypothetical protein
MSPELSQLRDELSKSNNHETSFLRGCIADLIKDKADRNLLNICLNALVLQDFLREANHDTFFIRRCINKLIEEFFITESAAEKAIEYCKFLVHEIEIELIPYRKGNKWGFCTPEKIIVVDCVYDSAYAFVNGCALVSIGRKYGYVNIFGELIINCEFDGRRIDEMNFTKEGCILVNKEEKYFFFNKNGSRINNIEYDGASQFQNELADVQIGGKNGYIDTRGNQVLPFKYDYASSFGLFSKFAKVSINHNGQIIDIKGNKICDFPYSYWNYAYSEKKAIVVRNQNRLYGALNNRFEEIIPCIYKDCDLSFSEGLVVVGQCKVSSGFMNYDWRRGFLDDDGNEVIPIKYKAAKPFNEGLAGVKLHEKYGFINKQGDLVIPYNFDNVGCFSDGLAPVCVDNKWGYINKIGEIVIEPVYEEAFRFDDGLAKVILNKKTGFINTKGECIIDCIYLPGFIDSLGDFKDNLHKVFLGTLSTGYRTGYIDKLGNQYWED